jgi:hypothetical protein
MTGYVMFTHPSCSYVKIDTPDYSRAYLFALCGRKKQKGGRNMINFVVSLLQPILGPMGVSDADLLNYVTLCSS